MQEIENRKEYRNDQKILVFQQENDAEPVQIGEYQRNYYVCYNKFFPFKHANGKWYALYSPDYTATRIMELPSCKDIGGEEPNESGFCPTDYYVPTYMDCKFPDHKPIRKSQITGDDVMKSKLNTEADIMYWHFGFVSGCIWGDDSSDKIEYLDLRDADKGIIKRSAKFGYIWLPDHMQLKDAIYLKDYNGADNTEIHIVVALHFDADTTYTAFDLSDMADYLAIKNSRQYTCPSCLVNEGTPHLETCRLKNGDAPYIYYPQVCRRCGKLNPSDFYVNETIWSKYIGHPQEHFPLCVSCFFSIRAAIAQQPYTKNWAVCPFCGSTKIRIEWHHDTQPHDCEDCGSRWTHL